VSNLTITYPLDDTSQANYTFDSDKIEFTASGAKLKLIDNPSQTFVQDFSSDVGFSYNTDVTEFVAGQLQQKEQWTNADSAADYNTSIDLSWGGGVLTGTAVGGASILNGELDLAHDDLRYVDYNAAGNGDSTQVGSVLMKFRPNYSGSPTTAQVLIHIGRNALRNNQITLSHISSGTVRISFYDFNGVQITQTDLGIFNPVLDQQYEFLLTWDLSAGSIKLYIDKIQLGSTVTATGIRTAPLLFRIGSNYIAALLSNFKVDDLILFPSVILPTDYPVGYDVWKYKTDLIAVPIFSYAGLGDVQSYDGYSTIQTGAILANVNNQYWNGSAWVSSDGSVAQMNTASEINANISTLTANNNTSIKLRTQNNHIQQDIDNLEIDYTGQIYPTDNPSIQVNSGVAADAIAAWTEIDVTKPANTELKYIIPVSPALWWNGSSWSSSSLTYSQSNTSAEITTNLGSLDISTGNLLKFIAFLNSDGSDTPLIKELKLEYDFFDTSSLPNQVLVYGQTISMFPELLEGVVVTINSYNPFEHTNNIVMIATSTTTNQNGDFELVVIETETVSQNTFVKFEYQEGTEHIEVIYDNVIIPDQDSISISELLAGKEPRGR
jgi:hypothetical protein